MASKPSLHNIRDSNNMCVINRVRRRTCAELTLVSAPGVRGVFTSMLLIKLNKKQLLGVENWQESVKNARFSPRA